MRATRAQEFRPSRRVLKLTSHPTLIWPADVPRSKIQETPRTFFRVIEAQRAVCGSILDFGDKVGKRAEKITVTLDHPVENNGDMAVAVYFDLADRSFCLTCDRFASQSGNLNAIAQLMTELTRALNFTTRHTALELLTGFVTPRPTLQEIQ